MATLLDMYLLLIDSLFVYYLLIMSVDIYTYDNYTSYLKAYVKADKNNWGLWAKIARAADCSPTYLSKVIKGNAHLTPEQVLGIAKSFQFSESEIDYFLLLLELARAGTKSLRDYIYSKISRIQKDRENIAKRLEQPKLEPGSRETLYYSAWFWSAIHVIVSIPEFQTVEAIASRLLLPVDFVTYALEQLEKSQIVKREGKRWKLGTADLHIPKNSPMIGMHHLNWRQRAVTDSLMPESSGLHYTSVYSISLADYHHLKEKILDLIEHTRKVVGPSKEEELICFTCDIFLV